MMKELKEIREKIEAATGVINAQKALEERKKLGLARAGSSGAITAGGEHFYTQCGRLAQARLLGGSNDPNTSTLTMFEGGLSLENFLEKAFLATGSKFSKEEPVSGSIGESRLSGRPDFDLELSSGVTGIEVKSMASPFSAIKQVKNGFPLIKHLVQACTYLLLLNRDKWVVVVGNIFYANERGFKVDPGVRLYGVRRDGDVFRVVNESGVEALLPFSPLDIERYYTTLYKSTEDETLMPRPTEYEINSNSYSRCKYCPMEGACNEYDNGQIGFVEWVGRMVKKDGE